MLPESFIVGLTCFQLFFILTQGFFSRRVEYVYYAFYCISVSTYFYCKYRLYSHSSDNIFFNENILDRGLLLVSIYFYIFFINAFVEKVDNLKVSRLVNVLKNSILAFALVNIFCGIFAPSYSLSLYFYIPLVTVFCIAGFYLLNYLYRRYQVLDWFAIIASLILILGAVVSLIARLREPEFSDERVQASIYMQISVIGVFICLNVALVYKTHKSRILPRKNKQASSLIEEWELYKIRNEISRELQFELKEELYGLKNMADNMKAKLDNANLKELESISRNSDKLVQSLNEIVWSLNTSQDDVFNTIQYIEDYILQYLEPLGITCKIESGLNDKSYLVDSNFRRQLLFIVKEILHNAVKHAQTPRVDFYYSSNPNFVLRFKDYGVGFNVAEMAGLKGNGLKNMKARVEKMGGVLSITTMNGTAVELSFSGEMFQ